MLWQCSKWSSRWAYFAQATFCSIVERLKVIVHFCLYVSGTKNWDLFKFFFFVLHQQSHAFQINYIVHLNHFTVSQLLHWKRIKFETIKEQRKLMNSNIRLHCVWVVSALVIQGEDPGFSSQTGKALCVESVWSARVRFLQVLHQKKAGQAHHSRSILPLHLICAISLFSWIKTTLYLTLLKLTYLKPHWKIFQVLSYNLTRGTRL